VQILENFDNAGGGYVYLYLLFQYVIQGADLCA